MADPKPRDPDESEAVDRALARIKAFYERGRESLAEWPARDMKPAGERGTRERVQFSEWERKARQFAHPERGYTPAELEALCTACRKAKFAMGTTHVIRLLTVTPRRGRAAMQRKVIAGRWSVSRLEREVRKFGPRRGGGRRRDVPDDKILLLAQLGTMLRSWRRWHDAATREDDEKWGSIVSPGGPLGGVEGRPPERLRGPRGFGTHDRGGDRSDDRGPGPRPARRGRNRTRPDNGGPNRDEASDPAAGREGQSVGVVMPLGPIGSLTASGPRGPNSKSTF